MFGKKDYIVVRGIGKLNCSPTLSSLDACSIGEIAESFPFLSDADTEAGNGTEVSKLKYVPEYAEYGFWVALLSTMTDYPFGERDLWSDLHETNLTSKLAVYYAPYIDELYRCSMDRIERKAKRIEPMNDAEMFGVVAKGLEGVDIGDVLNLAKSLSEMDGKEIVKAAVETDVP